MVNIKCFTLGPFQTNCYVVDSGGPECWIVDASFQPAAMIAWIRSKGLAPKALILTHAHVDHIAGVAEVRAAFPGVPVLIHGAESAWLNDPMLNLSAMMGGDVTAPGPDREIVEGDVLELGESRWKVLHTPGHSPGGITLWCEDSDAGSVAIVGDSLFAGSIGRTDFPGSAFETLERSIQEKLYTLPETTKVYPGHGPATTVGREKQSNPYVRG